MKKISSFILILVVLTGATGWASKTVAADPLGTCTLKAKVDGTIIELKGETDKNCHRMADDPANSAIYVRWVADTTDPLGTCTLKAKVDGTIIELKGETDKNCHRMADDPANSAIYVKWVADGAVDNPPETNTTYNLLSPLPGLGDAYEIGSSNPLGLYLNMAITIFIGICAILAVIMIVVGGLEYMTSELVSSKESGKSKITQAILGLLLALSAWIVLNQINPELLNADLKNLTTQTVTVDLMEEVETEATALSSDDGAPAAATAGCPEGIVRVSGISVCKKLAQGLTDLLSAAKATPACASVSGAGFRSPERQKELRIAHCKGNIDDRSAKCTPPTALPNSSRHQQGLAIDFMVRVGAENKFFKATGPTSACFNWFKANANKHKFYNLASEPWHWSVDGK